MVFRVSDLCHAAATDPERILCDALVLEMFEEALTDGVTRLERPHQTLCVVLSKAVEIAYKRALLFMPEIAEHTFFYVEAKRLVFEIDVVGSQYRVLRMSKIYRLPSEKDPGVRIALGIPLGKISVTPHAVRRMAERFLELHGHQLKRPAERIFDILMKAREEGALSPAAKVRRIIDHGFDVVRYLHSGPWRFVLHEEDGEYTVITVEIINRR